MNMKDINDIIKILKSYRFSLEDEKFLQVQIGQALDKHNVQYQREYSLAKGSIIDFLVSDGIGLEIKIKGRKRDIYNQCYRYSEFEQVKEIILLTRVNIGIAPLHDNKKFHIVKLGSSWL